MFKNIANPRSVLRQVAGVGNLLGGILFFCLFLTGATFLWFDFFHEPSLGSFCVGIMLTLLTVMVFWGIADRQRTLRALCRAIPVEDEGIFKLYQDWIVRRLRDLGDQVVALQKLDTPSAKKRAERIKARELVPLWKHAAERKFLPEDYIARGYGILFEPQDVL